MNRLNSLIIIYHLFKDMDKKVHANYYVEKVTRYLGFVPDIHNLFKCSKHEGNFIISDGLRNFDAIVDRFLISNTLLRIDDVEHIRKRIHVERNGSEFIIQGVSEGLANIIVRDMEVLRENKRLMRDIKIRLINS
jgi:hypothetical protein